MRPYDEALEHCTLFMKLTLQFDDLIMALMDEGKIRPPFDY